MISLTLIAIALVAVAATSYRMGRADERRARELSERLMRVIGGRNA